MKRKGRACPQAQARVSLRVAHAVQPFDFAPPVGTGDGSIRVGPGRVRGGKEGKKRVRLESPKDASEPSSGSATLTPGSRRIRTWGLVLLGALLVLDEVITFRSRYGGAQTWYDLTPDLTALGKFIGGGFPVGAIVGRAEVMEVMNPLADNVLFPHSGTFSANPVTMTAGLTAMELFDEAAVQRLNALADRATEGIEKAIRSTGIRACVTGGGSLFRVHLKETPPTNYREAFMTPGENRRLSLLLEHLFDRGLLMINTCTAAMSTAIGESEVDTLVAALESGFGKIRDEA